MKDSKRTQYRVAVVRCNDYNPDTVSQAVEKALSLLEIKQDFFNIKGKVLLKPNLLSRRSPQKAVTTHPAVIEGVIHVIRKFNVNTDLCIGDSPGGALKRIESYWEKAGFKEVSERTNIPLVSFDDAGSKTFSTDQLKGKLHSFTISSVPLNAEMIINLPKLKTHSLTFMTCALKNLFGLIPGLQKAEIHKALPDVDDFSRFLALLNKTVQPSLHIVDAVTVMEGNGPASGTPRHLGLILAGTNPLAIDMVASEIIGIPHRKVKHIEEAIELGIGPQSLNEIDMRGETIEDVKPDNFKLPSNYYLRKFLSGIFIKLFRRFFWLKPYVDMEMCKKCKKCIESCPVQAMELADGPITIDHKKCIKCLCCHELCDENAVKLKFSFLARLKFRTNRYKK